MLSLALHFLLLLALLSSCESIKATGKNRWWVSGLPSGAGDGVATLWARQSLAIRSALRGGALGGALRPAVLTVAAELAVNTLHDALRNVSLSVKEEMNREQLLAMLKRSPSAVVGSVKACAWSFASSATTLVPIALLLNINMIRQPRRWVRKGIHVGSDWARVGAFFVAGDKLSRRLRNKEDKLNSYIGSGISSAMLCMKEGPAAMARGFATGFAFMFVIDTFVVDTHPSAGPTMEYFHAALSRRPLPHTSSFTTDVMRARFKR